MKRISLPPRDTSLDLKALKYRPAQEADYDTLISESALLYDNEDRLAVAVKVLESAPQDLLAAFEKIKYNVHERTEGLKTRIRTIAWLPRVPIRRDFCTCSGLASDFPAEHATFIKYAQEADAAYRKTNPSLYAKAAEDIAQVLPEWRIPSTVFTSGICNGNYSIGYHHDKGNFPGGWSCMYVLQKGCSGGRLVLPEYRLAFSFEKPTLIMFDGQGIFHGVTPRGRVDDRAYRYSVVFYAMRQMCHCLPAEEELRRARKLRVVREKKRAGLIVTGGERVE